MKIRLKALVLALAGGLSLSAFNAAAEVHVSAAFQVRATADFYEPLAPYGTWVEVSSYGRCWRPASVAVEWRPYTTGYWVWTDVGWYWASDDPWAWACYHYGTWVYDSAHGWVWVPGIEWAPAWVYWRVGPSYIGWAPYGPRGFVVAPSLFVFVDIHRFHDPIRPSTIIVNNTTVINQTKVITDVKRETRSVEGFGPQNVVVNPGPSPDVIQKATGKKIAPVSIREAVSKTPAPATLKPTGKATGTSIPNKEQKAPVVQEQPKPPGAEPRPAPAPSAPSGRPDKPGPPEKAQPPSQFGPPASPTGPPAKKPGPPTEPGNSKAPGKGKDKKPDEGTP